MNKGLFSENFTRIFTAFYETPTNYVQANIQWHNIICDMLIPQRATLFGWAMLFPILILLYRAVEEKSTLYFAAAGVLAGGLPLIHTHSFLALGVMCAGFVILTMRKNAKEAKEFTIPVWGRFLLTAASLFALTYISLRQKSGTPIEANTLLIIGVLIAAVLVLGMLASLITSWEKQTAIHCLLPKESRSYVYSPGSFTHFWHKKTAPDYDAGSVPLVDFRVCFVPAKPL